MTESKFLPGTFVRLKTDPSRVGVVQAGVRIQAGARRIPVLTPDGKVIYLPEEALEIVPSAPVGLADQIASGAFVAPDWLRRTLARVRVVGKLADMVYSMEATDTDFYAHQFKPVLKLLNSPTEALLIADEVGLGKTIEAGLIWTELRARIDANRLLVLCPKTLCEKWRSELDRRFGVDAQIVGASDLLDLISPERSSKRGFAAIASMQSIRPPKGWDRDNSLLADEKPSLRLKLAQALAEAAEGEPLIDLMVIDEAHHMRNPETLLYQLGGLLNAISVHRVFLSATPVHLRNRDLNSLLRLIDPETFEFDSTLDRIIAANDPLVKARDLILNGRSSKEDVLALVEQARGHDLLSDNRVLGQLATELSTRPLDRSTRASIAWRLENANQLANYVTRTRRRDVEELRIVREPKAPHLDLNEDERHFYDAMTYEVTQYALQCATNERFLLATPQRMLTSSPAAASAWWEAIGRKRQPDRQSEALDTDDEEDEVGQGDSEVDMRPLVSRLVERARSLNMSARLRETDTKLNLLLRELRAVWSQEPTAKVVLFSSFKATLGYLQERLSEVGIVCELMHGSVSEPRDHILRRFREREGACVLLSSEVGSEGVDLQFCWIVINYDLPWNPMRLEQRIGRVDRLGQQKEKVSIINLVYANTIDARIYERLYVRLKIGERALGEFEAVLGDPIRQMTQSLVDPTLSEDQKSVVIDQTAQALANRARDTEQLEGEAGALVRHGDFILRQIREGRDLNRWLTGEDFLVYVRDRLHRSFPGSVIEASPVGSAFYRIDLSIAARERFSSFMSHNNLAGTTRLLDDRERMRYQFTASVIRSKVKDVENISHVHPLIRFCAELDQEDQDSQRPQAVGAQLPLESLDEPIAEGLYLVLLRHWSASDSRGRSVGMARLAYSGVSLDTGDLLEPERAEMLAMKAASIGQPAANASREFPTLQARDALDLTLNDDLAKRYTDYESGIRAASEDRASIRLRALDDHLRNRKDVLSRQLETYRARSAQARAAGNVSAQRRQDSLFAATKGRIRKLEERCAMRRADIEAQRETLVEEFDVAALLVEVSRAPALTN